MRTSRLGFFVAMFAALLTLTSASLALAAVSASTVTSESQLLSGSRADGMIGDVVLENGEIVIIISAVGHITTYGENGATVIDAGTTAVRSDALGELYTYFDDDWPRQAVYTGLTIVDNGSGGGPAIVRATGHDLNDSNIGIVTEYSLTEGHQYLTLTTWVTAGSSALSNFELGDAFQWGDCDNYAPGSGFSVEGTTTHPWMAGLASDVCYAYAGTDGDCWGPNGNGWSDLNVKTASIAAGATASYTRYFSVAGPDISAAVNILNQALGVPTGSVICNVSSLDDGSPLVGGLVDVFDGSDLPYLQMVVNATGQALAGLPAGDWRLLASATGYASEERWLTVYEGGTHGVDFQLEETGGGWESEAIGDTLTVIQYPLVNIPAMVMPGQVLEINCAADPATTGWQAELQYGAMTLPLPIATAVYDPTTLWWTLSTTVPAVSLYDLYDLSVTANGLAEDISRDAVRVLDQFKDDYYFIHITDAHLPDHEFSDSGATPADSLSMVDLRAVIDDINVINPEFVLITGDFINEGELEDYLEWRCYTRAQRMLYEFETPTYLVSGNHDIGGWDATPPPDGTARRDWWRFFGWPRLDNPPAGAPLHTQNYSFDYGPVHFVGMESYNNYDNWRDEIYGSDSFMSSQLTWLNQDLAAAAGSQSQVLFYHKDFQYQLDLVSLGVEMALWGHIHSSSGSETTLPYDLSTDNVTSGGRAYRLIRVHNGVLTPEPTLYAGGSGQNLRVLYSPSNAGLSSTVTGEITNNLAEQFQTGRLRFVMPAAGGQYTVTGGVLAQVDQSGPNDICHVDVDIPAMGTLSVTVSPSVNAVPEAGSGAGLFLAQNHPNPFNPATDLKFNLPQDGPAKLVVFDLKGREIAVLVDGDLPAGAHTAHWNGTDNEGRDAPSGVYLVRLTVSGQKTHRKMTLTR